MALLDDHVPLTRANGAHSFGPYAVPDGVSRINIRFARCTTARPTLWPSAGCEIAAQLYVAVDGGPTLEGGGMGHISADAMQIYTDGIAGGATPAQMAAQIIAAGKLQFGAKGGVYVIRGVDLVENTLQCPLPPGANRVVTGALAVTGGPWVTERTIEVI